MPFKFPFRVPWYMEAFWSSENLKFLEWSVTALWPAIYTPNATDEWHRPSGLGSWCGKQKEKADGSLIHQYIHHDIIPEGIQPGAEKLALCGHWMHLSYMHPVTSQNQFHCTRLYLRLSNLSMFDWPRSHFYRNAWLVPPKTPTSHSMASCGSIAQRSSMLERRL